MTNGGSGILGIGCGKSVFDDVTFFWNAIASATGQTLTCVNGAAAISSQPFAGFAMIGIASDQFNTPSGGLTQAELDALNGRASDIANFVNGGGGLFGFSNCALVNPYAYLGGVGAFTCGTVFESNVDPTPAGSALGITATNLDVCCWHDEYVTFPSFLGVLATYPFNANKVAAIGGTQVTIPGFVLTPATATNPVGTAHTVTITASTTVGGVTTPASGVTVSFTVAGANTATGSCVTNAAGQCTFTYTGTNAGTDTISATATIAGTAQATSATKTWIILDTLPPVTTATPTPAPNAAGWNNTDVTVTFNAVDFAPPGVTPSGVANIIVTDNGVPVACPPGPVCTTLLTAEGTHSLLFHAVDNVGNVEAPPNTLVVMIDKTPPTITATHTPAPNAAGWNNTDVTKSFICSDEPVAIASGVATCPSPQTITAEGITMVNVEAIDVAGNIGTHTQEVKIDKTAPELACRCQPLGPEVGDIVGEALDTGSGPGSFTLLSDVPEPSGELKRRRTYLVTDVAGNTLKVVIGFRQEGNDLRKSIWRLTYNDTNDFILVRDIDHPEEGALPDLLRCQWTFEPDGTTLKELKQRLEIRNPETDVRAEFEAQTDNTVIRVHRPEPDTTTTSPGVVFLNMTTNQGTLGFSF